MDQDRVFALVVDHDDGMARRRGDLDDGAGIDAVFQHPFNGPAPIRPDRADMLHPRCRPGDGDGHICPFAAQAPAVFCRGQCFPRCKKMRHTVEQIGVDRAKVIDRHAQPPLQAARTAMFKISLAVLEVEQIWMDLSTPAKIGPMTVAPAISCISLTDIDAEWRAGTTRTFAGPVSLWKG